MRKEAEERMMNSGIPMGVNLNNSMIVSFSSNLFSK